MNELVAWLRAQVDEDERGALRGGDDLAERLRRQAREVARLYGDPDPPDSDIRPADLLWWTAQDAADYIARHDPARVLAEVAAKRRIIDRFAEEYAIAVDYSRAVRCSPEEWHLVSAARDTLRLLASVYAGRPGWREEWAADEEAHRG